MTLLDRLKPQQNIVPSAIPKQRAFAYPRVSHADSAERGTSLETQRRDIIAFAARNDIEIVRWFEEPGKSAFKNPSKRVKFIEMIEAAKADPTINKIIVWKSDRFSRGQYEPSAIKGDLLAHGVRVLSVMDNYDPTTISGIVVEKVTEAMNHVRSLELSALIKRNLLTNAEKRDPETGWAYKNGGMAQWGYRNTRIYQDKERKYSRQSHCIWLLDEEVVSGRPIHEWARTMLIDWRLGEKLGYARIAQRLTEAGVPTPTGARAWSNSTIGCLLTWDRLLEYAGFGIWNKDDPNNVRRPASEWIVVPDAHPAIITEEEAEMIEAVRRPIARAGQPVKRLRAGRWLLTGGLIICGSCGANWCGSSSKGHDYYVCGSQKYRRGAGCVHYWQIGREELETAVLKAITRSFPRGLARVTRIVERINKHVIAEAKLYRDTESKRAQRVGELNQEIERLVDMVARGVPLDGIELDINRRIAERDRLEALALYDPPEPITVDQFGKTADLVWQARESESLGLRRQVIQNFVYSLRADPERHEITLTLRHTSTSTNNRPFVVTPTGVGIMGGRTILIRRAEFGRKLKVA